VGISFLSGNAKEVQLHVDFICNVPGQKKKEKLLGKRTQINIPKILLSIQLWGGGRGKEWEGLGDKEENSDGERKSKDFILLFKATLSPTKRGNRCMKTKGDGPNGLVNSPSSEEKGLMRIISFDRRRALVVC